MARNKHPEETVQRILDVSYRLFMDKGYDHTTIQDIVDALGMSKGAVYHHFKSKEDILDRINEYYYDEVHWFKDIRLDPGLTGLEKMREILIRQFHDSRKRQLDVLTASLQTNPRLIALTLSATIEDAAPFMQTLVEEGVRDGSIQVTDPKSFTEALMLLLNMWVGVFTTDAADFNRKLDFLQAFTAAMGLPLLDDRLREACLTYYEEVIVQP